MDKLEFYSAQRRDKVERIKEPPDNIEEVIVQRPFLISQPNNRATILWILSILVLISFISVIASWQRIHFYTIEERLKTLQRIEISLAGLDERTKSMESNYQRSVASISKELKNTVGLLAKIQSSIDNLEELSNEHKMAMKELKQNINDINSRLITLDNFIYYKEGGYDETKEGDNQ